MRTITIAREYLSRFYDLSTDTYGIPDRVMRELYWAEDKSIKEDDVSNKLYEYAIIRTNKDGDPKEILEVETCLAPSMEKAKMLVLGLYYAQDNYTDPGRLEVLVRPF